MPSSQKLQIRLNPTRQECSFDGPLQSLGFLFRYKMEDGGYTAGLSLTLDPTCVWEECFKTLLL